MHPMDDNLAGYLLDALDPASRRAVDDYLRTHPQARVRLERLRRLLAPLDADRAPPMPPPQLAQRTLARVTEARGPILPLAPRTGLGSTGGRSGWRRSDILVAAALLLVSLGLGATWLVKTWQRSALADCKENLHTFHESLVA